MSTERNKKSPAIETPPAATDHLLDSAAAQGGSEPVALEDQSDEIEVISPATAEPARSDEAAGLQAQADEFRDRFLRVAADLENFRKRSARERQEAVQFANQALLEKLIPVLDNLDMALAALSGAQGASVESVKTGVEMVFGQLKNVLREAGLQEIDASGQPFNPAWHEAVSQQESADVPEGQVIQQLRKGYKLRERLLRPASVVVARQPQAER